MTTTPAPPLDPAPRPVVAMVLYQGMTLLDLIGPHTAFAASMELHLVASTMDDVVCDTGVRVRPETTLRRRPGRRRRAVRAGRARDRRGDGRRPAARLPD